MSMEPGTVKRRATISDMLGIAIEPTYFDLEHYTVEPAAIWLAPE